MPESERDGYTPAGKQTRNAWVVVIEASAPYGELPYAFEAVRQLVVSLEGWRATGLFCADRYALQLDIETHSCSEALRLAMATHRQAAREIGMASPSFLRAEVLTPEVLQDDWRKEVAGVGDAPGLTSVPTLLYDATRALLFATSVAEVRGVLARFVADAGGSVTFGPQRVGPGQVTVDLGLGPNDQMFASCEALSVGGMLIELSLPGLVDDARRVFERLRCQPDRH